MDNSWLEVCNRWIENLHFSIDKIRQVHRRQNQTFIPIYVQSGRYSVMICLCFSYCDFHWLINLITSMFQAVYFILLSVVRCYPSFNMYMRSMLWIPPYNKMQQPASQGYFHMWLVLWTFREPTLHFPYLINNLKIIPLKIYGTIWSST